MSDYVEKFEPFLHIVHVSDIHCRTQASPTDLKAIRIVQNFERKLRRVSTKYADFVKGHWEQGLAGHEPLAHKRFCSFLRRFASDNEFRSVETWLLDTGDLSSMGDFNSIAVAQGWLKEYQEILNAKHLFSLYGNHDAWPGKFPLGSSQAELIEHRDMLRNKYFQNNWPHGPLSIKIPYTQSKLYLYGINSAIDDRLHNTFARGKVGIDPSWKAAKKFQDQLKILASKAQESFNMDGETRDFRVLAMHHPVHYPRPRPAPMMILGNDEEVADALIDFDKLGRGKLAQLVLSGHTHETFPRLGDLPPQTVGRSYIPLTDGQLQLITGSLAQAQRTEDSISTNSSNTIERNQCQILTFFAPTEGAERMLNIERRVVGRLGGTGSYEFLSSPGRPRSIESVLIEY